MLNNQIPESIAWTGVDSRGPSCVYLACSKNYEILRFKEIPVIISFNDSDCEKINKSEIEKLFKEIHDFNSNLELNSFEGITKKIKINNFEILIRQYENMKSEFYYIRVIDKQIDIIERINKDTFKFSSLIVNKEWYDGENKSISILNNYISKKEEIKCCSLHRINNGNLFIFDENII